MKFLKSDFSKVHAAVMLAALINILMGVLIALRWLPYGAAAEVHEFFGIALFPLALLLPALFPSRKQLYTAIRARFWITRRDLAHGKPVVLLAKAATMLMALGFVVLLITVFLLKTGLAYTWFPNADLFSFHLGFVYFMPVLMVLHGLLMWLSTRAKPKASLRSAQNVTREP